jgi:hypothetical protein
VLPVPVRRNSVTQAVSSALGIVAVVAWHAVRVPLLALLVTLEPVVRVLLTVLTVLLLACAGLFAAARPDALAGPLALVAASCGCALVLLGWYGAIATLQGRHRP